MVYLIKGLPLYLFAQISTQVPEAATPETSTPKPSQYPQQGNEVNTTQARIQSRTLPRNILSDEGVAGAKKRPDRMETQSKMLLHGFRAYRKLRIKASTSGGKS